MSRKQHIISYTFLPRTSLTSEWRHLASKATEAKSLSHSPYSQFQVGAAIFLDNGEILLGANQENASFPSCTCAEHVAISQKAARFPEAKVLKIAIASSSSIPDPISPCGNCRQILLQFELRQKQNIEILMLGAQNVCIVDSVGDLLPFTFFDDHFHDHDPAGQ